MLTLHAPFARRRCKAIADIVTGEARCALARKGAGDKAAGSAVPIQFGSQTVQISDTVNYEIAE
jgi:hypothetical protein